MKMTEFFLNQLDREAAITRRVLERVPAGKDDWKPHEKSMPMGYLASLVAAMPAWIELMLTTEEHEMTKASSFTPKPTTDPAKLIALLDESVAKARKALEGTTDEYLAKHWRMTVNGKTVLDQVRHDGIADSVFTHLGHHRGQLSVYMRLNEAHVPSIYGPTADEKTFGDLAVRG